MTKKFFRAAWRVLRGLKPEATGSGQSDPAEQNRQEDGALWTNSERATNTANVACGEQRLEIPEIEVIPYPQILEVALTAEDRASLQFAGASAEVQRKTRIILDAMQGEIRWLKHRRKEDGRRLTALHEEREFWRNSYYALIDNPELVARIIAENQRVGEKMKVLRARRVRSARTDTPKNRGSE